MATFSVNPGGLDHGAESLRSITAKLQQSLADLQAAATRYKTSNDGQAVDGYTVAQTRWDAGMDGMNASLGRSSVNLGSIRDNYVRGDATGASYF